MPSRPLIGREVELRHLCAHLDPGRTSTRLLTLIGPGGVGKTCLAIEAANAVAPAYTDGAVFVDLAPVGDPRLVAATIAQALDLRERGGGSARELLLDYLAERELLLVLDNFEHLLAAADLVSELLERCRRLVVLITSRVALRLRVERRTPVMPLAMPARVEASLQDVADSPAVRLFVERAQAVDASFVLQASNAAVLAAICRRLDGLPLAIELAAARAWLLGPAVLLRRLEQRLAALTDGPRDLPDRQRALRDTLAWSHDLLGTAEQRLFRRLALFSGGWTLAAAEAVCADAELPHEAVLDALQGLVDSSLVRQLEGAAGEGRFGMLETVREYALEQVQTAGEAAAFTRQHLAWCLSLVHPVAPGPIEPVRLDRIAPEYANLRAGLDAAIAAGAVEDGLWLAAALWMTWYLRGWYDEGRICLSELLALPGADAATRARAYALLAAGHLAYCQGDYTTAERSLDDARRLADQLGDDRLGGATRHNLAHIARWRGDLAGAEALYASALSVFRRLEDGLWEATVLVVMASLLYDQGRLAQAGECAEASLEFFTDADHAWGMARSQYALGRIATARGEHAHARSLLEASVSLHRRIGDHQARAWSLLALAHELLGSEDRDAAWPLLAESLTLAEMTGDSLTLARCLEAVGGLLVTSHPNQAVRLAAAADTLRHKLGAAPQPAERDALQAWLQIARHALGSDPYASAWATGQVLGVSGAVAEALRRPLAPIPSK
jgi:predicted ATPase